MSKSKSSKLKLKKKIRNFLFLKILIFFSKCQECWRSEGRKYFQFFFFDFLVQNDSIRKKSKKIFLKILIFFLSLRNVEGQKGEIFSKFFFLIFFFRMTQFAKKSKNKILKILIFFSKSGMWGILTFLTPGERTKVFFDMGFSLNVR